MFVQIQPMNTWAESWLQAHGSHCKIHSILQVVWNFSFRKFKAGLEAAVCSTDGEELPSHRLEATMGQITGLEKALPTFSVEEKTHWYGCVLLLPEGPVQGVLLLSAGQAPRELSPHLPSLLPAVGSILRGPWHVPKLSPLPVEVYFKTSYYRWSDWLLAIANFCKRLSDSENCLFHVQVRVTKTRMESVRQLGSQHVW